MDGIIQFSEFFLLPLTGTFKNYSITYRHNNHHVLRWYEWGLLVICNQHLSIWPLLGTVMQKYYLENHNVDEPSNLFRYVVSFLLMIS